MKQRSLGWRRHGFVDAVYYHIRPLLHCTFGISRMDAKMGAMGLVYNQRDPILMRCLCQLPYMGYNALISRGSYDHCGDSSPSLFPAGRTDNVFELLCPDLACHAILLNDFRVYIIKLHPI